MFATIIHSRLQETKDVADGVRPGKIAVDFKNFRFSSLRSSPGAELHTPVTAATMQQPK